VCDAVTVERQFASITQAIPTPPELNEGSSLVNFEIDATARNSAISPAVRAAEEAKRISTISRQITEAETAEALSKEADAESSSDWKWVLKRWDKKVTPKSYAANRECGGTRIPLLTATEPIEHRQFRLDRLGSAGAPFSDKYVSKSLSLDPILACKNATIARLAGQVGSEPCALVEGVG
jgi:hypothetical protein